MYAAKPGPGASQPVTVDEVLAELDGIAAADTPSGLVKASRQEAAPDTAPEQPPARPAATQVPRERLVREAAPVDALAVSSFKPIAGSGSAPKQQAQSQPVVPITGPWTVALIGSPPADLARPLIEAFTARGMQLVPADGAAKADAVLNLTSAAGGAAWYCEAPRAASSAWATAMLNALPGSSDQPPPAQFDCAALQGGWPRTPSALVQAPANVNPTALSKALADSAYAYFGRYGAASRRLRATVQLAWPATGPVTSYYGPDHPLGIDIGQWSGPVRAATDGTVYFAGGDPCCSYGRFVVIDSPAGIRTLYGHLDSVAVKTGQRVKAGQALGEVGCTGHCNGTHLHFEVIDGGLREDPLAYLP